MGLATGTVCRGGRWFAFLGTAALLGCSSVGPSTIPRDRFDYHKSISESWKTQMLMKHLGLRMGTMSLRFLKREGDSLQLFDPPNWTSEIFVDGELGARAVMQNGILN